MRNNSSKRYCATIGFFDGVHRGHQFIIGNVVDTADRLSEVPMVITFDRHPREVVDADYVPQLITTLPEKKRLIGSLGVADVEVLHFDKEMSRLSAKDFMREVLWRQLNVHTLLIGYDNRFGHNRTEGFADYVRYGETLGMRVLQLPPIDVDEQRVSSSVIRRMLADGDIITANECLGHRFAIEGRVAHGFGEGRKIGFPTANVEPDSTRQLLPKTGVYAVRLGMCGKMPMKAMMNIGTNPTFSRQRLTLEAHVFDFDGNLYDQHIRVEFVGRLRDERRFDGIDGLRSQLIIDMENAKRMLDR